MENFVAQEVEEQTTGQLINIWLECLAQVMLDQNRLSLISYLCKTSNLNNGDKPIKISIQQHVTFTLGQVSLHKTKSDYYIYHIIYH
jgi:hypothetical protein